ncbi:hypothetical protein BJY00DRAFT_279535 [Aspergillus carlsbadensis]|nr:hypothetical protein BJY00DRAFT_279535 [Aspergillus carlsbadensis]
MSLPPLQRLPAELLVLIYNSLPRIKDAVSLSLTCKKTHVLFERFEDRTSIIYSIVDTIPTSLPTTYPARSWAEEYFPRGTPFWNPAANEIPKELQHEDTLAFIKSTGFPVFECERLDFSSRVLEPAPPRIRNVDGALPAPKRREDDTLERSSSGDDGEECETEDSDSDSDGEIQWKEPLYLGTWFSQNVAVDSATGKIQRRGWEDDEESEDIAENVGRFLVLLAVIRSVMCDLQICGLDRFRKEQVERDEEVEEVVLEKLFDGLGAVDVLVREAPFWGWICNYLTP